MVKKKAPPLSASKTPEPADAQPIPTDTDLLALLNGTATDA